MVPINGCGTSILKTNAGLDPSTSSNLVVRRERLGSANGALDAGLANLGNEVDGALDVHPEDVPVELVESEGEVLGHAVAQQDRVRLVAANVQRVALGGEIQRS